MERLKKIEVAESEASQELEHINFLKALGFAVESLQFGVMMKCCGLEEQKPSGSFAYITHVNQLNTGPGLFTVATVHGKTYKHGSSTKGNGNGKFPPFFSSLSRPFVSEKSTPDTTAMNDDAARKARVFFNGCSEDGTSDYLKRKDVGSYSIRFKATGEHGNTAVIPMRDIDGRLYSYQFLNTNGSKVFLKNGRVNGLMHCIGSIVDGSLIGLAESYVTAASCYELSGISTICAFTSSNLPTVAQAISEKYPNSPIIVFADNDKHLETNVGLNKAREACKNIKSKSIVVLPMFDDPEPRKDATDWNDLIRIQGRVQARNQILQQIKPLS